MATEDLLQRLQALENSYYGDKEAARKQNFFDTYGARFSNNKGLGLAILNELDAQGIDTSAADEAVTQILDQLRTECNEIIESIKEVQQDAIDNARKVEAIQNVVSEQVASNPNAEAADTSSIADTGDTAVPGDETIDAMNPDNMPVDDLPEDYMPSEGGGEEMPQEGGGEEMPQEGGGEEMPQEGGGELPPNEVESDRRMKRIKSKFSARRNARHSWKPSAGILAAVMGGN